MTGTNGTRDVLIIGAGPAGLQLGYFLRQRGIDFEILERGSDVCEFLRRFPRHRKFISINKVHTGLSDPETRLRHDWNSLLNDDGLLFRDWSRDYFPAADDFVAYAERYAAPLRDAIRTDCAVTKIDKAGDLFEVSCADGTVQHARQVVVATGVSQPWDAGIEGGALAENYVDFETDPERYTNKRVLILGKGNSAFETADSLIAHAASIHVMSPNPIRFAWQTHFVGHLRAVNNNFLDTYQLKSQNAVIDAKALRIERADGALQVTAAMSAAKDHEIVLTYDHVIACTGFRFDSEIFAPEIRPALRHMDKFPAMTSEWESEDVPGLFFAGTIMQSRDYRKTMSGFIHGFRHNVKVLGDVLAARIGNVPMPSDAVDLAEPALASEIIARVSTGSGIFLQPGFLGDVIVLDGADAGCRLRDVPVDWIRTAADLAGRDLLVVTLEYGDFGGNALHVKRTHEVNGDTPDAFIHPVIRRYRDGAFVDAVHLSDHLDGDWRHEADRDAGSLTVRAMTFRDAGQELPPCEVAGRQLVRFLEAQNLANIRVSRTAAE